MDTPDDWVLLYPAASRVGISAGLWIPGSQVRYFIFFDNKIYINRYEIRINIRKKIRWVLLHEQRLMVCQKKTKGDLFFSVYE